VDGCQGGIICILLSEVSAELGRCLSCIKSVDTLLMEMGRMLSIVFQMLDEEAIL
jgi:hypothetical protein